MHILKEKMMIPKRTKFKTSDYLDSPEMIKEYLKEILNQEDTILLPSAINGIVEAME